MFITNVVNIQRVLISYKRRFEKLLQLNIIIILFNIYDNVIPDR